MKVPLLDLKLQYAPIREELRAAVERVLDSQQYINGPDVKQLEAAIAAYSGCQRGVAMSSGTDALLCSLMVLGIGQGDEVICPPFTFFATAGSIARTGAHPVFVDIEPDTFNIDPRLIERAITPRTKAIMPVHLFGQCADMDPILDIARRHSLRVIEDAAQAIGAKYKGRPAGSMGDFGCLSFYPSKNLNGLGDGGLILLQDSELADKCLVCRDHGQKVRYYYEFVGANFRLDSLQAAGLLVKLKYLDGWAARRVQNAKLYDELLAGCDAVVRPRIRPENFSVYNQYTIRVRSRRDELQKFLQENGVGSCIYYPVPLHVQECFWNLGGKPGDFPQTERACAEVLSLPIFPELVPEQIAYVADCIKKFVA
jgi:dTDP-4-amino-4,6-dideoxygalactose transaminase